VNFLIHYEGFFVEIINLIHRYTANTRLYNLIFYGIFYGVDLLSRRRRHSVVSAEKGERGFTGFLRRLSLREYVSPLNTPERTERHPWGFLKIGQERTTAKAG